MLIRHRSAVTDICGSLTQNYPPASGPGAPRNPKTKEGPLGNGTTTPGADGPFPWVQRDSSVMILCFLTVERTTPGAASTGFRPLSK